MELTLRLTLRVELDLANEKILLVPLGYVLFEIDYRFVHSICDCLGVHQWVGRVDGEAAFFSGGCGVGIARYRILWGFGEFVRENGMKPPRNPTPARLDRIGLYT
jgi:hypothetical protein